MYTQACTSMYTYSMYKVVTLPFNMAGKCNNMKYTRVAYMHTHTYMYVDNIHVCICTCLPHIYNTILSSVKCSQMY